MDTPLPSSEQIAGDYALTNTEARDLLAMVLLPREFRGKLLRKYRKQHGITPLINLFAEFIGLANSVVANNREMIEFLGIVLGGQHPSTVEKFNLPTIFGALNGVVLANGVAQDKTCEACAYRLGTLANQSPVTTLDAEYCADGGDPFMCHMDMGEDGEPKRKCIGHVQAAAKARRAEKRTLDNATAEAA